MPSEDKRYIVTLFTTPQRKERLEEFAQREGAEHVQGFVAMALAHCARITDRDPVPVQRHSNSRVPHHPHTEAIEFSFSEPAYLALDMLRDELNLRSNAETITRALELFINRPGRVITEGALPTFV